MDFIARAGSMLNQAHRLAGFLLVLLVVAVLGLIMIVKENSALTQEIRRINSTLSVYVVPGSQTGVYSPTQDDLLIDAFVNLVTQSLNTYTYETLEDQYAEVKQFFSSEMLAFSKDYFEKLIRDVGQDRRSALFIPDQRSTKVERARQNGIDIRRVTLRGNLQQILAGSVVETVPLEIALVLRKTTVSKTNPFGFMLSTFKTKQLGR